MTDKERIKQLEKELAEVEERLEMAENLLSEAHNLMSDTHCYMYDIYYDISLYFEEEYELVGMGNEGYEELERRREAEEE